MESCLSGIEQIITLAMNTSLLQQCTMEEVIIALQSMGPLKSSGPDGLTTAFSNRIRAFIGDEVCRTISNFFM